MLHSFAELIFAFCRSHLTQPILGIGSSELEHNNEKNMDRLIYEDEERTFARFEELPGELQNKIWKLALPPTPRIARLTYNPWSGWEMLNISEFNQSIEGLKYACRNSRYFCGRYKLYKRVVYESDLRVREGTAVSEKQQKKNLWLDPISETIFLDFDVPTEILSKVVTATQGGRNPGVALPLSYFPDCSWLRPSGILEDTVNITYGVRMWIWWYLHQDVEIGYIHDFILNPLGESQIRKQQSMVLNDCMVIGTKREALTTDNGTENQIGVLFQNDDTVNLIDVRALFKNSQKRVKLILILTRSWLRSERQVNYLRETTTGGFSNIKDEMAWPV